MVIRLGAGPSRPRLCWPASRRSVGPVDWWVPPAAGLLAGRLAPPLGGFVGGWLLLPRPDDEGFVEVSEATVSPPCELSL